MKNLNDEPDYEGQKPEIDLTPEKDNTGIGNDIPPELGKSR
jgi:hypothetical protein